MQSSELISTNDHLPDEIGDRRKAEMEPLKSEQRYRSIFENAGTATILMSQNADGEAGSK